MVHLLPGIIVLIALGIFSIGAIGYMKKRDKQMHDSIGKQYNSQSDESMFV